MAPPKDEEVGFDDFADDGEEIVELPDGTNVDELAAFVKAAGPQAPEIEDWAG